jgi:Lipocalin-like domain
MNRRTALALTIMALSGAALSAGSAFAQTAKDLVGTWKMVTNINTAPDGRRSESFGPTPNSILTFDGNGRFVFVGTRPDLPKFASNNRMQGTAEENKAIVQGSIAYFGTYSVVDKVLIQKVEGSTWPSWIGTDQKRPIISFMGDDMKMANPATTLGGTSEATYKRIK